MGSKCSKHFKRCATAKSLLSLQNTSSPSVSPEYVIPTNNNTIESALSPSTIITVTGPTPPQNIQTKRLRKIKTSHYSHDDLSIIGNFISFTSAVSIETYHVIQRTWNIIIYDTDKICDYYSLAISVNTFQQSPKSGVQRISVNSLKFPDDFQHSKRNIDTSSINTEAYFNSPRSNYRKCILVNSPIISARAINIDRDTGGADSKSQNQNRLLHETKISKFINECYTKMFGIDTFDPFKDTHVQKKFIPRIIKLLLNNFHNEESYNNYLTDFVELNFAYLTLYNINSAYKSIIDTIEEYKYVYPENYRNMFKDAYVDLLVKINTKKSLL